MGGSMIEKDLTRPLTHGGAFKLKSCAEYAWQMKCLIPTLQYIFLQLDRAFDDHLNLWNIFVLKKLLLVLSHGIICNVHNNAQS